MRIPKLKNTSIVWNGNNTEKLDSFLKQGNTPTRWRWSSDLCSIEIGSIKVRLGDTISIVGDKVSIKHNKNKVRWLGDNVDSIINTAMKIRSFKGYKITKSFTDLVIILEDEKLTLWLGDTLYVHNGFGWIENSPLQINGKAW